MRLLLLGSIAVTLLAQSPEAVQRRAVLDRFSSADPADLAWGAQLAARYNLPEFIPRIKDLLLREDTHLNRAALNALVQLQVSDAAPEILIKLLPLDFDEAMILLLRNPALPPSILSGLVQQKLDDHQWFVVHSAAAERRVQGQAAVLVHDWTFRLRIIVSEGGIQRRQPTVAQGWCEDETIPPGRNPNYPFVGRVSIGQGGSEPLTRGPHPLTVGGCSQSRRFDRRTFTTDYLAYVCDYHATLPDNQVRFTGEAQFTQATSDLRTQLKQYLAGLRAALIAAGALPADEWRDPKIEIEASDEREDRSIPLTGIDWFV